MRIWTSAVAAAALVLALGADAPARFDAPDPGRVPAPRFPVHLTRSSLAVVSEENLQTARLEIPLWLAREVARSASAESGAGGPFSGSTSGPGISRVQTVASCIALSLALVLGGLWVRRARPGARRGVVALVIGIGILSVAAAIATANMPPESKFNGRLREALPPGGGEIDGPVHVVLVADDAELRLVVPTNDKRRK